MVMRTKKEALVLNPVEKKAAGFLSAWVARVKKKTESAETWMTAERFE